MFSEDLPTVTLSLQKGTERLRRQSGVKAASQLLAAEATAIRAILGEDKLLGLDTSMELGSCGARQKAYEADVVVSMRYDVADLPAEDAIQSDLRRFLTLYRDAVTARQASIACSSELGTIESDEPSAKRVLGQFRPTDQSDYVAQVRGKTLSKNRHHERLVREFGEHAQSVGFTAATPHPRYLTLRKGGEEWLVEAKVVYRGNVADAVRAAIGQLLEYRYFQCARDVSPTLVALFTEDAGGAYRQLLNSLGISVA